MLNKLKLIILLAVLPTYLFSQDSLKVRGTYFIGAICKDGIVIGVDTRENLMTSNKKFPGGFLAYYDTIQKVFSINNFIIANQGNAFFGGKSLHFYLKRFSSSEFAANCNTLNALEKIDSFFKFQYPLLEQPFLSVVSITGGYVDGKAIICALWHQKVLCVAKSGSIASDTKSNFLKLYDSNYSCVKMAKVIEKCIYEVARKTNSTKMIGGPIMVLKITKDNKVHWIQHKPNTKPFDDFSEVLKAYKENRLKMVFYSKDAETYFKEQVLTGNAINF